jgi:hypothetical protein
VSARRVRIAAVTGMLALVSSQALPCMCTHGYLSPSERLRTYDSIVLCSAITVCESLNVPLDRVGPGEVAFPVRFAVSLRVEAADLPRA